MLSAILPAMRRTAFLLALILLATIPATPQTQQSPSPMVDHTRPHPRITQTETPGRRVDLKSLKGARLFIGPRVNPNDRVPLLIHFHGYESGNKFPHSILRFWVWSALTCQRFVTRRLVAAKLVRSQRWPRQVAPYESGNKLPHSILRFWCGALTCQRFVVRRLVGAI